MPKRLTTEEFIKQAKDVHGDKYLYDAVEYKNIRSEVKIFCKACSKYFMQIAGKHIHSKHGCPACGRTKKLTTEEFIFRSKELHGDLYSYDKVNYKNAHTKVKIFCKVCKKYFYQKPYGHFNLKQGCPICGKIKSSESRKLTFEEFYDRAIDIHGDKYDYSQVEYKNNSTKVKIYCNTCQSIFEQSPNKHLDHQHGCPLCYKEGGAFSPTYYGKQFHKSNLYIIKVDNQECFYKIGITSKLITQRFCGNFPYRYDVLRVFKMSGYDARTTEIKLHNYFSEKKYVPKLNFGGKTECFKSIDLDYIDSICKPLIIRDQSSLPEGT